MTTPFYVSPEQVMKDRADYARKGIARGRSVVVLQYAGGILFVAENPSRALHKISEIYDRVAFAAVGKYNEFETLRKAGVRLADLQGYAYDRRDVSGRALANAYAQTLGAIFTESQKPYEVEIVVAEVGSTPESDQVYRLTYDGSVADEQGHSVMGGQADTIARYVAEHYQAGGTLAGALRLAVDGLARDGANGAEPRELSAGQLEVAVLERDRERRAFRRLSGAVLDRLLASGTADETPPPAPEAPAESASAAPAAPSGDTGEVRPDESATP